MNDEKLLEEGKILPLVEEFYTLQGEGYNTGKAAYFIRIGGCDIGCKWCDSKFSWNPELHKTVNVDEIVKNAASQPAKAIVVTGGEPLNYNLDYLCIELKKQKVETFLETAGNKPLTGEWDWICLSPKKNNPPLLDIYKKANELKVIIYSIEDFEWAEEAAKQVRNECILYLQPEWSMYNKIIHQTVSYIKNNPKWKISLQSHKFMNIP
ncbi:MAG TPA: 7-carboxy-7-deazaguanine synthase QueE [Bacteroidales bacterium]|nr:MAG: 7-carboxy-7-deazaguanine synthase QueE [Bacteroidetes bacterium GWF2_33_38]OFY88570.1 MAG: 7-carboxy-7-deazaguanine synthase QueE [Bacteroidetes bacterium RIFOXYA2_FULL_33_7]HBF87154.1 7-carboxy-7-deazaguanine synthase QueE [Bacteroidales bacterium]